MYDQFSLDYDRFVNWDNRLAFEMPLLEKLMAPLKTAGRPVSVLDAACATGMHAIELARRGYQACGADLSQGMIDVARQNSASAGIPLRFETAGFGAMAATFGSSSQDAVLCLGNSLPHALSLAAMTAALSDFAACLRPGGLLVIQNRNFDKVLASRERWMEPQSVGRGEDERIFLRFYDYLPDGLIDFNLVTLRRNGGWMQTVTSTRLYPLLQRDLVAGLGLSGFGRFQYFGSMDGSPYDINHSDNLIVCAEKI